MGTQHILPGQGRHDDFVHDLRPGAGGDRLIGEPGASAADVKDLYEPLADFSRADLEGIPLVPVEAALETGAVYLDLMHRERGPFTALGTEVVGANEYYTPKARVDYLLWNRLTGVSNPARLDQPDRT